MDSYLIHVRICYATRSPEPYKTSVFGENRSKSGDFVLIEPDDSHPDYEWGQLTEVVDADKFEWSYKVFPPEEALMLIQKYVYDTHPETEAHRSMEKTMEWSMADYKRRQAEAKQESASSP